MEQFPCISLLNRPEFSGFWPRTEPDPGRWAHNNFFLHHQTDPFALILEAMAPKNDSESIAEKWKPGKSQLETTKTRKHKFLGYPPYRSPLDSERGPKGCAKLISNVNTRIRFPRENPCTESGSPRRGAGAIRRARNRTLL